MGRALAALVVLVALTGCVQALEPPVGGFTDEQSMARALEYADALYPDGLPDGYTVTVVEPQDLGDAIVGCLTERGFDNYSAMGDGVLWEGTDAVSEAEGEAWNLCSTVWQADPADTGALNERQLGYLYDYYRDSVVPCLAMAGITPPAPPTRAEFIASGGAWQPVLPQSETYVSGGFDLGSSPWVRSTPGGDLIGRCPTWPSEWKL